MTQLLSTQHPRLYINTEKIEQMKTLVNEDAFFHQLCSLLTEKANQLLNEMPVAFKITGPRMLKNCQEINDRVSTLALVYHLTGELKFANRAKEELFSAALYPHWNKDHFLDTAELITAFAIGYDWLFHVLNPDERVLIKKNMINKGIAVGLAEHASNIWWAGHKYNWNQVCNGGLIIGALAIADEEPQLFNNVLEATVKHLPTAFNSFGKQGGWEAGPDYWQYTTWYSALLIDALLTTTGNDFGLSKTEGFDQTGLFPIYNAGATNKHFNFADADEDYRATPVLYWLGTHFKQDACIKENGRLLQQSVERNEAISAFNLVWYAPAKNTTHGLPLNKIYDDIDAGYFRSNWGENATSVAFKGGYNQADHAHLDLGTFVFDRNGVRWAVDLGRDSYDLPNYFDLSEGGGRWEYFRLNTKSHNTLVLNNDVQRANAKAKIINYQSDDKQSHATIDLSEAYQPHAKSVFRTFNLIGNSGLLISDKIESNDTLKSIQWQLLTDADILITGNEAKLSKNGKIMRATIVQPANAVFEVVLAEQAEPQMSNKGYKLLTCNISDIDEALTEVVVLLD